MPLPTRATVPCIRVALAPLSPYKPRCRAHVPFHVPRSPRVTCDHACRGCIDCAFVRHMARSNIVHLTDYRDESGKTIMNAFDKRGVTLMKAGSSAMFTPRASSRRRG